MLQKIECKIKFNRKKKQLNTEIWPKKTNYKLTGKKHFKIDISREKNKASRNLRGKTIEKWNLRQK